MPDPISDDDARRFAPSALIDVIAVGRSVLVREIAVVVYSIERYVAGFVVRVGFEISPDHPWPAQECPITTNVGPDGGWQAYAPAVFPRLISQISTDHETELVRFGGSGGSEGRSFTEELRFGHPAPRACRRLTILFPRLDWIVSGDSGTAVAHHSDVGPWTFDVPLPPVTPFDLYPRHGREPIGKMKGANAKLEYGLQLFRVTGLHTCGYCGLDLTGSYEHWLHLQVDHVVPTSVGKTHSIPAEWITDLFNLVLCCSACNAFNNRYSPAVHMLPGEWTLHTFCLLRDRIFLERRSAILARHEIERKLFRTHWLSKPA